MSWDMASEQEKLDRWERRLREQVGEGDLLLGELEYTKQDLEEIGGLLYRTVFYRAQKLASIDDKLERVYTSCPLTFALYLVLEGIHHYGEEGRFWHGPKKRLKIKDAHTDNCGQCFLKILAKHNLPTFEQSRGLRYVTRILLHGGIPDYSLEKFFAFLYQHEVQLHRIAIDAQTLVAKWRQQADDLETLSKPVSRFLRHGGLVAEDFVARCLDLFRTAESDIYSLGLPERVHSAYRTWRERQSEGIHSQPRLMPPIRLQRPVLIVAPYSIGIALHLPPQQIPSRVAPREMSWRVTSGGRAQCVHTNRRRIEDNYRYEATSELLQIPRAENYVAQILADGEILQEWVVPGLGELPLIVFDPYDDYEAEAPIERDWHMPGERWLLYPEKFSLRANGASQRIRQMPQLTGAWQGYCLEVWKLSPGKLKLLDGRGVAVHHFPVVQESSRKRPFLKGGKQPLPDLSQSDFPLYCGQPPTLVIDTTQPQRWQVSLRSEGNARPARFDSSRLSDLPCQRHEKDSGMHLDLSADELLGSNPIGRFEITVRGPLGHNYTLGLRMIPHISVAGHDRVYLSHPDEPASLRIISDAATKIRLNPPRQTGVHLPEPRFGENRREYALTLEPHVPQVAFQLSHETGADVLFSIPIHRLRWSLYTGSPTDCEPQWQTWPFSLFPAGFAADAELRVTLPLYAKGPKIYAGWRLLDADGQILRAVPPDRSTLRCLVPVPLTEVLGLWREKRDTLRWQWELLIEDQAEPVLVDVLYLLPDLGKVQYEWEEAADQIQLTVYWENPHPGHKQLHLWPLDRLWVKEPITRSAPDKEDSRLIEWRLPKKDLPSESYLGEIVTDNPWASQRPQRPAPEQPNTVLIKPPGLSRHYAEIIQLRDQGKADAEQLLTLFTHQRYNDQRRDLHCTNQALVKLRGTVSLTWLVRWAETTRKLDSTAYILTQLRMFDEPVIERLKQEDLRDDELESYFQHLWVNMPLERLHLWVLQSGLHAVPRRRCLELLCRLKLDGTTFSEVMSALLEDVGDGALLFSEAVTLLTTNSQNSQAAAEWLAVQGAPDAAELLRELTRRHHLEVSWIWPHMTLDTSIGSVIIHNLRDRDTGRGRHCAPLSGRCYADGILKAPPSGVPVRLDLSHRLLRFNTHGPYQCQYCQQLFRDMSDYTQHHESMHIGQTPARRRLKQDQELAWIRPLLDDE